MSEFIVNGDNEAALRALSTPHPEWQEVAESHKAIEEKLDQLYSLPIEEFRKIPYRAAPLGTGAPEPGRDLKITESKVAVRDGTNVGIRIYQPLSEEKGRLLYFNIHGGGWTTGAPESEEGLNRAVAVQNNAVVISVDYRLAPEFPFPYALNDSYDVFEWTMQNAEALGADPNKIVVGGGSAGSNVATVIAQIARDKGIKNIIGQLLNIPVTCHPNHFPVSQYSYNSYNQNAHAPFVNASRMELFWNNYLPSADSDPRASPLLAESLENLPPALVQIAGMDPLRDEGLAYAKALKNSGIHVTLKVYPGMPHAFYIYPNLTPSIEYTQVAVDWIKQLQQDSL